jgi:hypothetical protein
LEQGHGLLSLQPAQLAEGESGEGTARACSVSRAFQRSVLEKKLRVRVSPRQKFPQRPLNLRNVDQVLNELSHMRARCRDKRGVGLELSNALRNCCNARAGRFDVSS